jgi:hypothetical protein
MTKEPGFKSSQGQESFLHSLTPILAVVSIHPHYSEYMGLFLWEQKWLGCETNHTFWSGAKIKNVWSCITAAMHLYGLCLIKYPGSATLFTQACIWKVFQMDQSETSRVFAFKMV